MSTTESSVRCTAVGFGCRVCFHHPHRSPVRQCDACASIFLQTKIPFQLATWMTCDWCPIKRTIQKRFSSANNFPAPGPSGKQRDARVSPQHRIPKLFWLLNFDGYHLGDGPASPPLDGFLISMTKNEIAASPDQPAGTKIHFRS